MLTFSSIRVAVLCSGRAPGLAHLLARRTPRAWRGTVVCCVTSEETFADAGVTLRYGVPLVHHSIRRFYAGHGPGARVGDLRVREDYDGRTLQILRPYNPDVIVLAGYLWLLTRPMLAAFDRRVLNVHHSDLLLRTADGRPRYPGLRAVRDAILAGEPETRSTAHLVTERLDDGPALLRSWPFPVPAVASRAVARGDRDVLRPVIRAHQEWMLRSAFGPLMEHGIERIADDDMAPIRELIGRQEAEYAS